MKLSIDLGLAIAHATIARRGVQISHKEIAAYCDCTWNNIWRIEQKALHKLKRAAMLRNDTALIDLKNTIRA